MSEEVKKAHDQICKMCDGNDSVRLGVELACTLIEAQRGTEAKKEEKEAEA